MHINKITVFKYKPLLHFGNSFISIDITSDILVLIGNNGSGKSMLLKEITPFPSTSTDYEAGGYKIIELSHNGSEYVIKSSFENKKKEHSFIKDNIELNESGTSSVQSDLCISELGLSNIIKSIITGSVEITNMGKAERKQLLLACYPSNLTFILNYHKKIVSEIKTTKDNLKLLNSRKLELESSSIPNDTYEYMCRTMDHLNNIKDSVNKTETLFIDELSRMKNNEEYNPSITTIDYNKINGELEQLNKRCCAYRIQHPELFKKSYKESLVGLNTSKQFLLDSLNKITEDISALTIEIENFERMNNELSKDKILGHENIINNLKLEIAKKSIDPSIPILTLDLATSFNIEHVRKLLTEIHSAQGNILTQNNYNEVVTNIRINNNKLDGLLREYNQIGISLKTIQQRLDKLVNTKFNNTCFEFICPARDKYADTLNTLKQEELSALQQIEEYSQEISGIKELINEDVEKSNIARQYLESVNYIDSLLNKLNLNTFILQNKELIEILNNNPLYISNILFRVVENSISQYTLSELNKQLEETESKLVSLLEVKKETNILLGKSIDGKKSQLTNLSEQYINIKSSIDKLDIKIDMYRDIENMSLSIEDIKKYFDTNIISYLINAKIQVLETTIIDISKYKQIVEDEQISLKTSIKEKESIKIRLEQEIIPSINNLSNELKKLELLEKALSPMSGIPHIYMVRFINNIIKYVNIFISKVWNYEMELLLLKEDKPLDFDFQIKLFNNSILKDIDMLSKGQKEMLNLAFTLALFIIMKLGTIYPIKLDEVDSGMSHQHRDRFINLLVDLTFNKDIGQLFLINHNVSVYTSMSNGQVVCLDPEGIILPAEYNTNTILK